MMLREARVVLPKNAQGHARLRRRFAEAFGGYTETEGRGGWVNGDGVLEQEQVRVYDVAMDPGPEARAQLSEIARGVLLASKEAAIYVRYADGDVEIIER